MKRSLLIVATWNLIAGAATAQESDAPGNGPPPERGDWDVSLAVGTIASPTYLGDDSYIMSVVPSLSVNYKQTIFLSFEGLGANLINSHGFRAGPLATFDFGRNEDGSNPLQIVGGRTDDLDGLDNVDFTIELGGFVEYSVDGFVGKIELVQGTNGHHGLVGSGTIKYQSAFPVLGKMGFYSLGPEVTFADSKYMDSFFGVSPRASSRSGLARFEADGGLRSAGFHATISIPLTRHISLTTFGGYDQLLGDAAESPLVRRRGSRDQGMGGAFLSYSF
ncbi:MAG: MipA/OmpV family protein [Myxococcota bacterium]